MLVDGEEENTNSISRCRHCRMTNHTSAQCNRKEFKERNAQKRLKKEAEARANGSQINSQTNSQSKNEPKNESKTDCEFKTLQICNVLSDEASPALYFKVKIADRNGSAQCDHGADFSVCSESLYSLLKKTNVNFETLFVPVRQAFGAPTETMLEVITAPLTIDDHTAMVKFMYCPSMPSEETLIGRDAINKLKIIVWSDSQKYKFVEEKNWRNFSSVPANIDTQLAPVRFEEDDEPIKAPFKLSEEDFPIPEWTWNDDQSIDDPLTKSLTLEFPEVFQSNGPPTDLIEHSVHTESDKGFHAALYRPAPRFNAEIETEIKKMLEADIIEECESAWTAPIVLARKKDGLIRLCIDYRKLNEKTIPDRYPMPEIDRLLHSAKQSNYMSTLDLQSGYWQVPVVKKDRDKTAFVGPSGLYRFKRMPFGPRNAPATFQRLADSIKARLPDIHMFAYLDDFIVISDDETKHLNDLRRVLSLMKRHHLRLNAEKCRFFRTHVRYLGHLITNEGISTDPEKVKDLLDRPTPTNKAELLSFTAAAAWYRRFIPGFSAIVSPLHQLTLQKTEWKWDDNAEDAFNHLRQLLTHAPILQQADLSKPFKLYTDASDFALGAVLVQGDSVEGERPIEFASRRLVGAEIRYTTTEKEALAVVWALEKFKGYVVGGPVRLANLNQALRWLFSLMIAPISISRDDQLRDAELRKIITAIEAEDNFTTAEHYRSRGYFMSEGLLYRLNDEENDFCPLVVPLHRRQEVLKLFHGTPAAGHFGAERTLAKVSTRYYWPSIRRDVKQYFSVCIDCQRYKPIQRPPAQLYRPRAPAQRFEVLSLDFMGPLTCTLGGERHILVI